LSRFIAFSICTSASEMLLCCIEQFLIVSKYNIQGEKETKSHV